MRHLILSDIHANLEALVAVLAAAPPDAFDRILVLGDLVGYGADPGAVIDRVRALHPYALIRGNHDKVACGIESGDGFNATAREAARWTYDTLTPAHREFLAALPAGPTFIDDQIEVCHGTPFDEDAYVFDKLDALRALKAAARPVCFFGHTHLPVLFSLTDDGFEALVPDEPTTVVTIEPEIRYLINPGSVGQPRDGDARAAYATFDSTTNEVTLYRIRYPVEVAQTKILAAGLPETLAYRLSLGR